MISKWIVLMAVMNPIVVSIHFGASKITRSMKENVIKSNKWKKEMRWL